MITIQSLKNYKLIGKGLFTKCYDLNNGKVVLVSSCPVKEALALGWFVSGIHWPECERIDYDVDNNNSGLYVMPKYDKPTSLKSALVEKDYKLYLQLKELAKVFQNKTINNKYDRQQVFIETVKSFKGLHYSMKNQLITAVDGLANYTCNIGFEVSPRNVAVKNKRLILLDLFFSIDKMNEVRNTKR